MKKKWKIVLILIILIVVICLLAVGYISLNNNISIDANTEVNNLINSSEYQEMTTNERKVACEELLSELKSKGAIKHYSYSESDMLFSYETKDGILGGIKIQEWNSLFNWLFLICKCKDLKMICLYNKYGGFYYE